MEPFRSLLLISEQEEEEVEEEEESSIIHYETALPLMAGKRVWQRRTVTKYELNAFLFFYESSWIPVLGTQHRIGS